MNWGGPQFVLAIIAISTVGWIVTTWIRARHGYPVEGEWGGSTGRTDPDAERKLGLLATDNEALHAKVTRLEDRISVLERIATDQPARLSAEIDQLR